MLIKTAKKNHSFHQRKGQTDAQRLALSTEIANLLYTSESRSFYCALAVITLILYLQSSIIDNRVIFIVLAVFVPMHLLRHGLAIAFHSRKVPITSQQWIKLFRVTTLGCGLAWGIAGTLTFIPDDPAHQALLAIALAGVAGGASTAHSSDKLTIFGFSLCLLSIGLSRFFINAYWQYIAGGTSYSLMIALMVIGFVIFTTLAGLDFGKILKEHILLRLSEAQSQAEINALSRRQKLHMDHTPLAVIEWDTDFRVTSWNNAATKMFGYSASEAINQFIYFISPPSQHEIINTNIYHIMTETGGLYLRTENITQQNNTIYCEWFNTVLKDNDNEIVGIASLIQDETAYINAQKEIQRLAYYDALTSLPNRRLLLDRVEQTLAKCIRNQTYGCLMFIDLDNFKILNDTKGHAAGDLLLQEVAKRLQELVRAADTVARIGGDEFILLLEEISHNENSAIEASKLVATKVIHAINQPFQINQFTHQTSPSLGISLIRPSPAKVDDILKYADTAMYQSKKSGRNNYSFFDENSLPVIDHTAKLKVDLQSALRESQLTLYFQPQMRYGRIIGAEVLLRWIHPQHGFISPAEFIPIAEESGIIVSIGNWVLRKACEQIHYWQSSSSTSFLKLSVNVSARQFSQPDFVSQVRSALTLYSVSPTQLTLELTESIVINNIDDVVNKMRALKELGVSLSLDDFGTGYSSLSVLKKLPLDELKIDQSFVSDITDNPDSAMIVQTMIVMGDNLRLAMIAEGVETEEQASHLQRLGCINFQGYLFGKPVPIEAFNTSLQSS